MSPERQSVFIQETPATPSKHPQNLEVPPNVEGGWNSRPLDKVPCLAPQLPVIASLMEKIAYPGPVGWLFAIVIS
jgi:hypothetical protein